MRLLEPGLELGRFRSTRAAHPGDSFIHIARIDPAHYTLGLFNTSAEKDGHPRTAREWATARGLAVVINASMYQQDLRRSVSLMRTRTHVNNPRLSKDKAILAFDALAEGIPPVQIIDRECQDFDAVSRGYGTLVQSIRMVSCAGRNVWAPQPRAWSTAAIGIDRQGRVLFIHARAPHTTHDLIEVLMGLPIDLKNALYAEGGPEAQMFVRAHGEQLEYVGALDPSSGDESGARLAWPIPNVIGATPLKAAKPPRRP